MTKEKPPERRQEKRSTLSYFAFLMLIVVVLVSLKKLNPDKPSPKTVTLPKVELTDVDPMVISAVQQAEQRVKKSPSNAQLWGDLGIIYWVNELHEPGRLCLQKSEEFEPDNGKWIYLRALTYLPDNTDVAIPLIEKAADLLDSKTYAPRLRLANILSEDGRINEAEPHYKMILKNHPSNPMAELGLGRVAMAMGNHTNAIERFLNCKDHKFTKKAANNALASLYLRTSQPELATQAQQSANDSNEDSNWPDPFIEEASKYKLGLAAWLDSAGKLVRRGQYAPALPLLDKIISNYPETGQAYIYLAKIRLAEKKFKDAETALLNALKYEPDSVEARVQLGVTLMWQKRFSESIIQLKRAIDQSPDLAEAHYNLGLSLASNNELQAAAQAFSDAIRLKPGLPDSYIGLATMLVRTNQRNEAIQILEKALQVAPKHPRILSMLQQLKG